jgi:hypothetical protein
MHNNIYESRKNKNTHNLEYKEYSLCPKLIIIFDFSEYIHFVMHLQIYSVFMSRYITK